jgi:sporulation protein YabP
MEELLMNEEKKSFSRHNVLMENRSNITVTGVTDVISFDEETIVADTEMGVFILRGRNLHISKMNLGNGDMEIDGEVISFTYEESGKSSKSKNKSIFSSIFK